MVEMETDLSGSARERAVYDLFRQNDSRYGWSALGGVCFHAHQCVEKLLKACLIARSVRPRRTHDLHELLDACDGAGVDLQDLYGPCDVLQELYPRSRYPEDPEPAASDAEAAIAAGTAVRDAVLPMLERAA